MKRINIRLSHTFLCRHNHQSHFVYQLFRPCFRPAKKGFLKPVGEWNYEEVIAKGSKIKVILNNEVILDGDIEEAVKNGTPDTHEHPGLKNKTGHIGFLGHGSVLRFRNIRIKAL